MSFWAGMAVVFVILYVVLGIAAHMWRFWDDWKRNVREILRMPLRWVRRKNDDD